MITSIANSLGFGSGIDTARLVSDLAAASRAPKVELFASRARTVEARISAVSQARGDLDSFAASLTDVVTRGTLQTRPTISDESLLSADVITGSSVKNIAVEAEVLALARPQTSVSSYLAHASDPVGQGSRTLSVAGQDFVITIGAGNDSLTGLADAINASGSGVAASIVTDTNGARLVLKGPVGAAGSFTLDGNVQGAQITQVQAAQDASVRIDGISYTSPSNTFSDVIPGIKLTLKKAAPGTLISLGSARPTDAIRQTLGDFVSVFNTLKINVGAARTATGGNQALRSLDRQLSQLISQSLGNGATLDTLSNIGIATNRDGSISLNTAVFDAAIAKDADAVEALFAPAGGIATALKTLKDGASAANGPLDTLKSRLDQEATNISKGRAKMEIRETAYRERLQAKFGTLDARVGALKATQSYLDQQIKIWTNSGN
jgi:flagellar hook-associated protein 2